MIQGVVNAAYEAVVTLPLQDPEGRTRDIEAVIDTGYSGFLTLPPRLVDELGLPFAYMARRFWPMTLWWISTFTTSRFYGTGNRDESRLTLRAALRL